VNKVTNLNFEKNSALYRETSPDDLDIYCQDRDSEWSSTGFSCVTCYSLNVINK